MDEVTRLQELEADCRRRALSEADRKWYWLAQAAKYQMQASRKVAFSFDESVAAKPPEVRLALWPQGRDGRRLMEPLSRGLY